MQTLWFTGLSGSGKTTLAEAVQILFKYTLNTRVVIIDGDEIRQGLNSDLGYDENSRTENIRRCAEICRLLNSQGVYVIATLTSPLRVQREMAKEIIGGDERFIEFYIKCSIDTCAQRDVKGLYKKFNDGVIKHMVGIDLPYEEPVDAVVINTDDEKENIITLSSLIVEKFRFHGKFPTESLSFYKFVKLRFNHDAKSPNERWRLYYPETKTYKNVAHVSFHCRTHTSHDLLKDENGNDVEKWHVTAMYTQETIQKTDDSVKITFYGL